MIVKLKTLKNGELFKRKSNSNIEYIRGDFNRGRRGNWPDCYSCSDSMNVNREIFLHGSTPVWRV